MGAGGALGAFLCVMVFGIALGTLIGAVFLRAACAFYNRLAGGKKSPNSVPEPLLGKAMGITFVTSVVNVGVSYGMGLLIGAGSEAGASEKIATLIANLLSLPVSILVMAGMNAAMLPTTFVRGLLVALCYLLVVLFVFAVLAAIFGGLFLLYTFLAKGP